MRPKTPKAEKMNQLCRRLPDWTVGFFWETGTQMAISTRLEYAAEIDRFFDYITTYLPDLAETPKDQVTLEQFATITSQDISRYVTIYQGKGDKERTLARKRAALSSFFSYLVDNRKLTFNPVAAAVKVKIHQSDEVTYLNMSEQIRLLDTVDTGDALTATQQKYHERDRLRDIALISLLLDTGLRVSEVQGSDIADVDLEACSILVQRKGGNFQTIFFGDAVRDAIAEYLDMRREKDNQLDGKNPLFVTYRGDRLAIRSIQALVKKYSIAAIPGKGKKISPHKMRSSFAMEYYEDQKDILALQRKLGHKSIVTTNIYAKATDKKMQETRSVLEEKRKKMAAQLHDDNQDE